MIGKTNGKAAQSLPCEYINITLQSNQSSHDDLIGTAFMVSCGSVSKDYVWDGNEVVVEIPAYVEYTVSFSSVNGYKSPESVTNTAVSGNSRNITGTYQTCVLTVSLADNQSAYNDIANAKANVAGNSVNASLSSGSSVKIPVDEMVTITGTEVSGYSTPSATYTADAASKTVTLTYATEILTVNVSGVSSEYTVSVKKGDGTLLGSQTASGKTYKIPSGTQYYVEASEVADYTTPAKSSTFTAGGGSDASRSVSMVYELAMETVIVNVVCAEYAYTTISEVDSSIVHYSGSDSLITVKIKSGIRYRVDCTTISGYLTPDCSEIYTAVAGNTRNISRIYVKHPGTLNPTNGIYILDNEGYYHTEAEWDGSCDHIGIAVITDDCRFAIATEITNGGSCIWGGYGTLINGITTEDNIGNIYKDYDGKEQTQTIINQLGTAAYAAYYCRYYIFPNGFAGYLGALSEWQAAVDNKQAINSAITKCGGLPLSGFYWTSTQYDSMKAWCVAWPGGNQNPLNKNETNLVRAFLEI